jgi:hypothetical protein
MVEEDTEPGEDEGEFSGGGGTALGCFVWIRLSERCSLLAEKLKFCSVVASEGMWNIVADSRPESEDAVDAGTGVYTYADSRKLTACWALQRQPVKMDYVYALGEINVIPQEQHEEANFVPVGGEKI